MSAETFHFTAADLTKLHAYRWRAENPKAVLQITHGAVEHAGRYGDFAEFLNREGISAYAFDLRGHGKTAGDPKIPYFCEEDGGWEVLRDDMYDFTRLIKEENPGTPLFLLGHSMGAFLAVSYFARYGKELKGGVLSGTGASNPALLRLLIGLATRDIKKHGCRHPSPFLHGLVFGSLNAKIKGAKTPYDFICTDRKVIDAYMEDEYCGNTATSEFLREMARGLQMMNRKSTYESTPKDLAIFMISGEFDPLAGGGQKAMRAVYNRFVSAGIRDISMKVYPGARHEVLNEPGKQEAYRDVADFILKRCQDK